jgi:hypothetical protein
MPLRLVRAAQEPAIILCAELLAVILYLAPLHPLAVVVVVMVRPQAPEMAALVVVVVALVHLETQQRKV